MKDSEIEKAADEVLAAHDVKNPPIDPFVLARLEKIRLAPGEYDGCFDARLEYRRKDRLGRFYLFYAQEEPTARPEGRVRFSIAHELGHFYLPGHRQYLLSGIRYGCHCEFVSDKLLEREADQFAAALLMPRRMFIDRVQRMEFSICTLRDLVSFADSTFRTSITSTAIRYVQLNCEPCCVVLSRRGEVLYAVQAEDVRLRGFGWIESRSRIPATSVTAKMLAAPVNQMCCDIAEGEVNSGVWFDRGPVVSMWEEAKILGRTGLILTFLTLDDDQDEDDNSTEEEDDIF